MYELIINGKKYNCETNKNLLSYLRDDLHLTGAKNACGNGACGACSIIVDEKLVRSCVFKVEKMVGKNITTIEGISQKEKDIYTYAFAHAGAVQCGFCIPGFVIASKVLLDKNSNPSEDEIKNAISNNICRCTGYVKIIDAIKLAAKILSGEESIKTEEYSGKIGTHMPRLDAKEKTLGTGLYVDDMHIEGMIYGGVVRSKYPRARIISIDTSKASALEGVETVMTADDIPGERYIGHLAFLSDWPALIAKGEITRYLGDGIVLIAAKTKEILEAAKALVEIEYEELSPVDSIKTALDKNSAIVQESSPKNIKTNILVERHLKNGDVDAAIKNSKYVVTNKYITPATEHAFMEPESAIGILQDDGSMLLYTGAQGIYDEQREVSLVLGLPKEKVRVVSQYVGGGFGGKEDMSVQHHTALLALKSKKPVKITLTRSESMIVHPKRHLMEMEVTSACDENGMLTAVKADIYADTGAYASLGGPVLERACTHAVGPYICSNTEVNGYALYTNNMPAGAFRGFGVCQSNFATESNMNLLAEKVGISAWDIRYKNAIVAGKYISNGQIADEATGFVETLLAVKDEFENNKYAGIASAFKNSGIGMNLKDTGRCRIFIKDGKINVASSAACIGQGIATVMLQICSEILDMKPENFIILDPDTSATPNSGTTTASRQTVFTGEATRQAALLLKEALKNKSLNELEGQEFATEFCPESDPLDSDKENPKFHEAYGFATHVVILNEDGTLKKVVASHDVGRIINPRAIEGQVEGGVVMSLGYALTEDFPHEKSVPTIKKYAGLRLLKANQVPEIVTTFVEKGDINSTAFGAKGMGEIASIPTAAAVQHAYYKFNKDFETKLPLTNTPYAKKKTN